MCYSATASFVASGGLVLVGVASYKVATKKEKVLALIPFFFAVQQAFEGVQWLFLNQGLVCRPAGYGFLFFALTFWPVYIPVTIYVLDRARRTTTRWFVVLGFVLAAWLGFLLITVPLSVRVVGQHIFYTPPGAFDGIPQQLLYILYVAVTCGVMLLSSKRAFRRLGLLSAILAVLAAYVSWVATISVWCFFAASISLAIYFILHYRWLNIEARNSTFRALC